MEIKFKPAARNEGQLTVQREGGKAVPLVKNDKQLVGGDLVVDRLYTVNVVTGEVTEEQ